MQFDKVQTGPLSFKTLAPEFKTLWSSFNEQLGFASKVIHQCWIQARLLGLRLSPSRDETADFLITNECSFRSERGEIMGFQASWIHGNALTVENPENLNRVGHFGWGADMEVKHGKV